MPRRGESDRPPLRVSVASQADRKQWEAFTSGQPTGNLLQSWGWGNFRERQGWVVERMFVQRGQGPWLAAMQVLSRALAGPLGWAYAPQGPVLSDLTDAEPAQALLSCAASRLRRRRVIQLKCDPQWPVSDAATARLLAHLRLLPAAFDIQHRQSWLVDIGGGEDEAWSRLPAGTRRNVRLAQRRGVWTRSAPALVEPFYRLHQATVRRQGFASRPVEYFEAAVRALDACVFLSGRESEELAAAVAVRFGERLIYLYGGTSGTAPEARASYAMHWEMIRWGMEGGCTLYDMWGVPRRFDPANPEHGYAVFKTRWGGGLASYPGLRLAPVLGPLDRPVHALERLALRRRPLLR